MSDATGNGNNGTYSASGVTYSVQGLCTDASTAVSFASGSASVPSAPPTLTQYTVETWIAPATVGAQNILTRTDAAGPGSNWSAQLRINASGKLEHYLWDGSVRLITGTTVLQAGHIYHVAGTATNAGAMHLYVNGAEEGAPATIGTMYSGTRWAVADHATSGYAFGYFNGSMDEVAIYPTALSAARLAAHYASCVLVCTGDCGGNSVVTVDELLTMVNIALGQATLSTCPNGDGNHDGLITVDEILTAVDYALNGCPLNLPPPPTPRTDLNMTVEIWGASAYPGDTISFPVVISGGTSEVGAINIDVGYPNVITTPSCTIDPRLREQTLGTNDIDSSTKRVMLYQTGQFPAPPVSDGVVAECQAQILGGAAVGNYPLAANRVTVSDLAGNQIASAETSAETIQVLSSGGGCTVDRPERSSASSLLLLLVPIGACAFRRLTGRRDKAGLMIALCAGALLSAHSAHAQSRTTGATWRQLQAPSGPAAPGLSNFSGQSVRRSWYITAVRFNGTTATGRIAFVGASFLSVGRFAVSVSTRQGQVTGEITTDAGEVVAQFAGQLSAGGLHGQFVAQNGEVGEIDVPHLQLLNAVIDVVEPGSQ